jgi:hypothetical protein
MDDARCARPRSPSDRISRIPQHNIFALVDKLDGERDTALFGACRDEWTDVRKQP